jgi:transposase-like protein
MQQSPKSSGVRSFTISEKKSIAMQWSQSKLKMQAFCGEHGISTSMLKNWRKQFGTPAKVPRRKHFIQLKPIVPPPPVPVQPYAEIISGCGAKIVFHQAVEISILKAFLTTK